MSQKDRDLWRARRACCGERVQWDASEHDWLEGWGAKLSLVAMIDDASRRALARFVEHGTTEERVVRSVVGGNSSRPPGSCR